MDRVLQKHPRTTITYEPTSQLRRSDIQPEVAMPRHFSPAGRLLVALAVSIASTSFAQSTTQVLYVVQQNVQKYTDIVTYNVDPTTLQATRVGKPFTLSNVFAGVQVIPSPDGHFIYVLAGANSSDAGISVYATGASGVPQGPAIQSLGPAAITQFVVHPSGKFAYLIDFTTANQEFFYQLQPYMVDQGTGYLTETSQVHKFKPTQYCTPFIAGFYPDGSELEYDWGCYTPDNYSSQAFFQESVDLQTGALGRAAQIFGVSDTDLSSDQIKLAPQTINDFYSTFAPPLTELKIYPLITGPKKPLIVCTALMLSACSQAQGFLQDQSGRFLLLELPSKLMITKIDLSTDTLVDTGYSLPAAADPNFSPDDSIIYDLTFQSPGTSVQLYGFDAQTGAVTQGERFEVAKTFVTVFPAQRK
jgi:hypothetical protein